MALFGKRSAGQNFISIFDVGSASIGGAFVLLDSVKPPEIVFMTRESIPIQKDLNFARYFASMLKTIEGVFLNMKKAGGEMAIDGVFCILASPWYASQTRIVHQHGDKGPTLITHKLVNDLIQKEMTAFRNSKLFSASRINDELPEIMEVKNIQTKLNGYETRNPYNERSEDFEMALYLSMIPPNVLGEIRNIFEKHWTKANITLGSFSFVAYDTIRELFPKVDTFLFLDVSGELTDVSLVKDGVLVESLSFPVGKNMLIRAMTQGGKISTEIAVSELKLYLEGRGHGEHNDKVEELIEKSRKEWLAFLQDGLARFAEDFPIPHQVYFTADDDAASWYAERMHEVLFTSFAAEDGQFNTTYVGPEFLTPYVVALEPSFRDPFLVLEALYAQKVTKQSHKA